MISFVRRVQRDILVARSKTLTMKRSSGPAETSRAADWHSSIRTIRTDGCRRALAATHSVVQDTSAVDLSLGKRTGLPSFLGEGAFLEVKANFFNAFNKLNLAPFEFFAPTIDSRDFGRAQNALGGTGC